MRVYTSLLVVALVAFVLLALLVHGQDRLLRLDRGIAEAVQSIQLPLYGWVLTHTSDLGFAPLNLVAYAAIGAALLAAGLRLEAVLVVASPALAGLVGAALKHFVGRARPTQQLIHVARQLGGYSFPSGHVLQYTTLFGFAFYVVLVTWRPGPVRTLALVALALPVLLVGPSRVYLGQHWPSDTLGAYLLGGLWLAATIELHLALKTRLGGWWVAPQTR
jgi:membrane-associated phospholipid phosphatase